MHLSCIICDAPARAFGKQVKSHNAYHGYKKCVQRGSFDKKVVEDSNFDKGIQQMYNVTSPQVTNLRRSRATRHCEECTRTPLRPKAVIFLEIVAILVNIGC
ncbi:uncharacterized protein LOC143018902 [Oratosquilla oratoria]|uniref:uncharacterized protein LOC143018902 n=1 Tax=Oratosquilla oratoria TaxID=337810 RepID=UPI003F76A801